MNRDFILFPLWIVDRRKWALEIVDLVDLCQVGLSCLYQGRVIGGQGSGEVQGRNWRGINKVGHGMRRKYYEQGRAGVQIYRKRDWFGRNVLGLKSAPTDQIISES